MEFEEDPAQALEAREMARHSIINETIARGDSDVQQFYSGATVLVTGGSGFLGKQLIEKLFRSCRIKKLFILLRCKKQKTTKERLTRMLEDPAFEYLHAHQPEFVSKIVPVEGDVTVPRLAISDDDWDTLTDEVDIIFHGAATINFTDPIKKATLTNVHGTREMLRLAKECKQLRSFVHISTAYAHATIKRARGQVLEQFYETSTTPDALIQMVENTEEYVLDTMTPHIIKGWPNTYAFTKAVAEEEVRTMSGDLPVCIVRPAIVICAYREPLPGWIDKSTVLGPSGFVVGSGLGILHVLYAADDSKMDLVPVDIVNNAAIVAAQETAVRKQNSENDVKIYTVSSTRNAIYFGKIVELITVEGSKVASTACVWYGYATAIRNRLLFNILHFFAHCIPGYLVDAMLMLFGKKPILTKVYKKVYKYMDVLGFFTTHTWDFGDSNLRQLYWSLSPADRVIFNFNVDTIDWTLYIVLWCIGCRKYIIKDGLKDTNKGVRKRFYMRILNHIVVPIYLYLIYKTMGFAFYILGLIFKY